MGLVKHTVLALSVLWISTLNGQINDGFTPVAANDDWTPVFQTFNHVEMVLVPVGCFMMGSAGAEDVLVPRDDEQPIHEQCFDRPFWLDRTEVTHAMYGACVEAGVCSEPFFTENYTYRPEHPVTRINWRQARTYCEWRDARLPTEAEWEYAARGPDGLVYPWGNTFEPDNVVYYGNAPSGLAEVATKPGGVSWVGAFDLAGNAWEWTSSLYVPYPYVFHDGREDPAARGFRVLRGGGWYDFISCDRATNRVRLYPSTVDGGNGFRCARDM